MDVIGESSWSRAVAEALVALETTGHDTISLHFCPDAPRRVWPSNTKYYLVSK